MCDHSVSPDYLATDVLAYLESLVVFALLCSKALCDEHIHYEHRRSHVAKS